MDRLLDIATGNSRKTKKWRNKQILWSDLTERLKNVTKTSETMAEYAKMSRDRQSAVKDVGGFVGGYCRDGNRTAVEHRSMLTLDADYADSGIWEDWQLLYGYAAALYSTHKHRPESPRLRIVIPLIRDVDPDEYQAVARRVASDLGMDKFDDTTYQPFRLMYWPSCSYDGEYVFESLDGNFLDPDAVLATYTDWHDMSTWPMSSRVTEIIKRSGEKQKDPLEKPGLVGVFCRTYGIREAIEKFVPAYEPCGDDRYTYTGGSTAAGVVIYEDKFSYSHHSTDPAGGQLCNAWDLVRIHHFHELDAGKDEDTAATKLPSYTAMTEFVLQDEAIRAASVQERMAQAAEDFDVIADAGDVEGLKKGLQLTDKGAIASTINNVALIMENDPRLAGCLALNDFQHTLVVKSDLPWRKITGKAEQVWTDSDDALLRHYMERVYGISGKDKIYDGVNVAAQKHAFHPVREYLESCDWDGVPRIEELLIRYLGAEDTPYTRAVTKKHLVASVARIMKPGAKYDQVLTIRGRQGIGKSTIIARLGGEWYTDTFNTVVGKEAYEQVQGVWAVEIGELAGMKKSEVEATKLFISKTEDRFRPAYGRRIESFPRQCVFWATTNEMQFLRDTTGNRRWWVVDTPNEPTGNMWAELTPDTVKLIWGEAVELWKKGEPLWLDKELECAAIEAQDEYTEESENTGIIKDYLDRLLPDDWYDMDLYQRREWLRSEAVGTRKRGTVSRIEIWAEALERDPTKMERMDAKDIQGVLSRLPEWRYQKGQKQRIKPYGLQRYYKRYSKKE